MTERPRLAEKARSLLPESRWKDVLVFTARFQESCINPPVGPLKNPWVSMGKGYLYGPAFGHWDLVHAGMDALRYAPSYVRMQLENYFSLEMAGGMLPGTIYFKVDDNGNLTGQFDVTDVCSHPPLWQELVSEYYQATGDIEFLRTTFEFAKRNLAWWEKERSAPEGGFYYMDVVKRWWESGVDHGVRWDEIDGKPHTCIDATCHIQSLYRRMAEWAEILAEEPDPYRKKASELEDFVNTELWDEKTGFFYDIEMVRRRKRPVKTFEGFWPLSLSIATDDRLERLLAHLTNRGEFFTYHPVATVSADEREYSQDCWRGPAWNSQTFWIARGCSKNGFTREARLITEKALDATLSRFRKYNTLFEFYNSQSEDMEAMARKGQPGGPCKDYLTHNPLNAFYWLLEG